MKNCCLVIIAVLMAGCVMAEPRKKITFHVMDEESGVPLTNAQVTVFNKGWHVRQVDANGHCTFEGSSAVGKSFGWTGHTELEGYYKDSSGLEYSKLNHVLNRWEPWNPTIEVKLRQKKNPVPMVVKRVESLKILVWDKAIGFDLESGDWVAPHGKGTRIDFFVDMHRRFNHSSDFDAVANITFPNEGDGIQLYKMPDEYKSSSFKFPYEAPVGNYQDKLVLERHATLRTTKCSFDPKKDKYIFRVRTKKDEDGNVVSACYGRIDRRIEIGWGEVFDFGYHFNPIPNERSLEYSGKDLLKK